MRVMVVLRTRAMHIEGNHAQRMVRFDVVQCDNIDATLEGLEDRPRNPRNLESIKRHIQRRTALRYLHPGHLMIGHEWESAIFDNRTRQSNSKVRLNRVLSHDSLYVIAQSSVTAEVIEEFLKAMYGSELTVLFEVKERAARNRRQSLAATAA